MLIKKIFWYALPYMLYRRLKIQRNFKSLHSKRNQRVAKKKGAAWTMIKQIIARVKENKRLNSTQIILFRTQKASELLIALQNGSY